MNLFKGYVSFDISTVLIVLPLVSFGIVMILSSAPALVQSQLINMIAGFIILLGIYWIVDSDMLKTIAWPAYFIAIGLILAVFLFGDATRGSYRWIEFGFFRLQASEFVKPLVIIFFAYYLSSHDMRYIKNVLISLILFSVPFLLIVKEPDLGSALVIAALYFSMLFLSGVRLVHFIGLMVVVMALLPIGWQFTHQYQRERVMAFLNPQADPLGKTYNITQAIITTGSGELFGRGLGRGTQTQLDFLPERHTDFIFSSIGEELGFVGSMLVVLLYIFLFWRLLLLAEQRKNTFEYLMLSGIGIILFVQAFIHIGGNLGLLPLTGITLPFISYGGSSVVSGAILIALCLKIGKPSYKFGTNSIE